jgi:hypothetical protein
VPGKLLSEAVVQVLPDALPLAFRSFQNLALQPPPFGFAFTETCGHRREGSRQFLDLVAT